MMDYRYNNKIETDIDKSIIQPLIVLTTRSGRKIGVINNIQELRCNHPLASASEISFDVYKEINGVKNPYWDLIKDFKFIYLPTVKDSKFKWYEITIAIDEGNDTIKHVTGIHANEAELGQLMLYNVEINTEEDINRDDYEIITIDDKEYGTVFYNPDHPKASLLHRILSDKASHYSILHVDETLKNIQREFSFNGTSIVDALNQTVAQEIGCLFVYGQNPNNEDDGIFHRTISAYDLMDYCEDCGERGTYTQGVCTKCGSTKIKGGYGKDTGIFINSENLSDSISLTSSTDQVKNFFKMGAGDEYMEAAIRNCNPNGSNYLYYFSDEMKEDMSDELISKLDEYNTIYDSYLKDYNILLQADKITDYNALVRDYQPYIKEDLIELQTSAHGYEELTDYYYNSLNFKDMLQTVMMPASEEVTETTAQEQLDKLTVESMSPIGVEDASAMSLKAADTAVKSYAKVYVDTSRYKIELSDSAYVNNYWTGTITITSLTDEEDTGFKELTIQFNNDGATFLKQKIEKAMKEHEAEDIGDVSFLQREYTDEELETDFKPELKKYSLDALSLLDDLCVAVMDILADAGQGEESSDYYEDFYHPFWKKRKLIMDEEKTRESEIATVEGVIVNIEEVRADIINYLDLHNYFGDELYSELMLYRRETEYSNPNFISDGLSDSEIIDRARDYFKRAQEEIIKASTLQHSISASLYNLFLIPEFRKTVLDNNEVQYQEDVGFFPVETFSNKLINLFDGGNWLRIRVDDKIYKLRLTNWEINYDDPEQLEVEFSDVVYSGNTVSDIASVLSQARTMATSYDAVMRQAEKGNTANNTIEQTKKQGLILNQNKIINNVDSQSFVLNSQGALMRAKNDFDDGYSPEQIKLLNKGIYYTNDDWETVKAGLGHFMYYDPDTKTVKEDYGIIASTIVGQLLLGENLKIYSESGKFEMGDDGLKITAIDGENNADLFVVQKESTDGSGQKYVEKYIYVDSDGEVKISGSSITLSGKPLVDYISDAIDDADIDVSLPVSVQIDSSTGVVFNSDSISATLTATVYRGGTDITSQITEFVWTKKDKKGNVDSSWTKTTSINTLDVNIDNINDKVIIGCEVEVPQEGVTTTSYGSITISKIHDGSQFWTSTVAPTSPDYTFTVSDLVGDTNADIKDGDIIYYSHYRYTVTSVSANGTTVLCGNRESLRGADGISPTVKSIVCSHSAVVCEKDGSYNPNTITFNGQAQTQDTISSYKGWFVIELSSDAQTWVSSYSSASKESFVNYKIPLGVNITKDGIIYYQGSTITVNGSVVDSNFTISSDGVITTTQDIGFIIRSIRCSLYSDSNKTELIDQQRVNIAFDGVDGENGDDGYTVVLSNENHTFAGNTTSAIDGGIADCDVIGLKGGMPAVCHIGTISGCPTGMTASILVNDSNNAKFRVAVTSAMTSQNGILNVPVTVDEKLFNMKFTYSLKLNGLDATGLGWMVNYSAPTVPNDGECIYYGFDEVTKEPSFNTDGWVLWNGQEVTIPHGCYVNPDDTMPYNTTIYSVYRLPTSTTYTGGTFHDVAWVASTNSWKSNTYNGTTATADVGTWTWDEDRDIILAMYVEPSNDGTITNAQLFTPPKKFSELVEPAKGMAKEAEKVAYHYLKVDSSGVMVANMTDDDNNEYTPSNIETGKRNILITADDLRIRNGQNDLAIYGETTRIGQTNSPHLTFNNDNISAYHNENNKYFEVGNGSELIVDTYEISDLPITVSLQEEVLDFVLVELNDVELDNSHYEVGEDGASITIDNRPSGSFTLLVRYNPVNPQDSEEDESTDSVLEETFEFTDTVSLTIEPNIPDGATDIRIKLNDAPTSGYTLDLNNNILVFNQRPSSGDVISISYNISKVSPYFTFNNRNQNAEKGLGSASFGLNTIASGQSSSVFGIDSSASAESSFASGKGVNVNSVGGMAVGTYNNQKTDYLFVVGNGTSNANRSNAFVVDKYGRVLIKGRMFADGRSMFAKATFKKTISVSAKTTAGTSINIAKAGYTPWGIQGIRSSSASCNLYQQYINGNKFYFKLYNPGTGNDGQPIKVTIIVQISYMASTAL